MSGAYVIEIDDQTAGLVIAERRGYRFVASEHMFRKLDGRVFAHVRQAHRAAAELWRAYRGRAAAPPNVTTLFTPADPPARVSWGLVADRGRASAA